MKSLRETPAFWTESWALALQALAANKLRAILTTLGVVIGSASIVLVVTVALTGKQYILKLIEGVGSNIIYADLVRSGQAQPSTLSDEISLDDMAAVKTGIPHVAEAAGTNNIPMTLV